VAGAHQIAAGVLDRAHQVAETLLLDARHIGKAQLAGCHQPRQPLGIATVGLDPIAGSARDQTGRRDTHLDATLGGRTSQPKARRPRLIDRHQRPTKSLQIAQHAKRRTPQPPPNQLTRLAINHRGMRLHRVHIEPHHQRDTVRHGRHLP
jgi:hypothetical protein